MKDIKDIKKVGKVASATKVTSMSLEDIQAEIKRLNALKKAHEDYSIRTPKAHTVAKNRDIDKILNSICGRNQVLTKIRKLFADGTIVPNEWTDKDFNEAQFKFALKGTKQFEQFLPSTGKAREDWVNGSIMVRTAVNQLINVAVLSQGTFAKRQMSK